MTLRVKTILVAGTSLATAFLPGVASARTEVHPYIEAAQVLDAQLMGKDELLTYSSLAAGVDVSLGEQRTTGQISYRYEHRFGWGKKLGNSDNHTGLARVSHQLVPEVVTIDAGAIATRSRDDIRGGDGNRFSSGSTNSSQVYSAYIGPTITTHAGPVELGASYRLGYTSVESSDFVPTAGQPRLDSFDHSLSHEATVSAGMSPGVLPFGWEVTGSYTREQTGQLEQRFEGKGVRGDITVPVTESLALLGGAGYEQVQSSQRAALFDAGGNEIFDAKGRVLTDPTSPRLIAYDFDGVYWDVGVGWHPSRRTSFEAHVGRRYDSWSYTGSLTWQASENSVFQIGAYDEVTTFGQQLGNNLASLPTNFDTNRNPLSRGFNGCTYSSGGGSAGGCFNSSLGSTSTAVYRGRGVSAQYAASTGRTSYGFGLGYSARRYKTPTIGGAAFSLNGVKDENWYVDGNMGYKIDQQSAIDTSVFANLYNSGIIGAPSVTSIGGSTSYQRSLGRHVSATAAVGAYTSRIEGQTTELNAQGQIGVRVGF
jgi:hypothetical protein